MSAWRYILASLRCYWRTDVCIVLGIALATAVIMGSLLVGDSMSLTLRHQALLRLGEIDQALIAPGYFTDTLGQRLKLPGTISTCLLARASAQKPDDQVRSPSVRVVGADEQFWSLFPAAHSPALGDDSVVINQALADDLKLAVGDELLLDLGRQSEWSDQMIFTSRRRQDMLRTVRASITAIVSDAAGGAFGIDSAMSRPRNAYLIRDRLAAALQMKAKANAIFTASPAGDLAEALRGACTLADHGLKVARYCQLQIESRSLVLSDRQLAAIDAAAAELHLKTSKVSVYLATRLARAGAKEDGIAYLMVAAMSNPPAFDISEGKPLDNQSEGIWLNAWAAEDLKSQVGDSLEMTYLLPRRDGSFVDASIRLPFRGVAKLSGDALDRHLAPELEGLTDAGRMDQWKAPFPIDHSRITGRDEQYWDQFGPTPKAFIDIATMQKIWAHAAGGNSNGWITAVRIDAGDTDAAQLEQALLRHLSPLDSGLAFRPVRRQILASASGSTDFAQLFLGLSFFLIAAALALAGLTVKLLAEQRAGETGLLLACGFGARRVFAVAFCEYAVLVIVGVIIGLAGGIAYGRAILVGMNHYWPGPWKGAELALAVSGRSIAISAITVLLIGLGSAAWFTRSIRRRPVLQLLVRRQGVARAVTHRARWRWRLAVAMVLVFVGLAALFLARSAALSAAIGFFIAGACMLSAAIIGLWGWFGRALQSAAGTFSLRQLAIRNLAANGLQSLLVFGTFAAASFILVTVGANRQDLTRLDWHDRKSGAGGFSHLASTTVPLRLDITSRAGRARLGFSPDDEQQLGDASLIALGATHGDDVSCLNLAAPVQPRLLGASPALIDRNAFNVDTADTKPGGNPWLKLLETPDSSGAIPAFGDAESVRWILHRDIGDVYTFVTADGHEVRLRIAGLIHGSIFAGELLVGEDNLRRIDPRAAAPSYLLVDPNHADPKAAADVLRRRLSDFGIELEETPALLARFVDVQNTYLSIFQTLGGLGLLLGAVGTLAVIWRNVLERRGELALMSAVGFAKTRLVRLLVTEYAGLILAGLLCGSASAMVAVMPAIGAAQANVNWPALGGLLLVVGVVALVGCVVVVGSNIGRTPLRTLHEE